MDPFVLHGDVAALIRDILLNHTPELTPYDTVEKPLRVSTDLRGYSAESRWIRLTAGGGSTQLWNVVGKPPIDVEVRAESRNVAHDMAQICFASIFRAVPHTAFGETMSEAKTELGVADIPGDKEEVASYRYLFRLRLTCLVDPSFEPESF